MAAITDRSDKKTPVLNTIRMNHGTLGCRDVAKTRRFYEEVLGLDVVQTSPISLMVRKGTDHVYAVVETPPGDKPMNMMNHNGFEVGSPEEVDQAHAAITKIKDEWGLKVQPVRSLHGDHTFYFLDFDGNWWEIVSVRQGGYVADFQDQDWDLTGHHERDDWARLWDEEKKLMHLHDPEVREQLRNGDANR